MKRPPAAAFMLLLLLGSFTSHRSGMAASKPETTPAKLQLEYTACGEHAAFAYGVKKGFYAREGIDLTLLEGKGSLMVARDMAKNPDAARYGWADAGTVVKVAADENAPLVVIADYLQVAPQALATFEDDGYRGLKDLIGKKIAFSAKDTMRLNFPALLKANHLEPKQFGEFILSPEAKLNALITKTAAAVSGFPSAQAGLLEHKSGGRKVRWLMYADMGLSMIAHGLITQKKNLTDRGLNCRMIRATSAAWLAAGADPDGAVEALHSIFPNANGGLKDATRVQWIETFKRLHSKRTEKEPPGKMDLHDWEHLIQIQTEYGEMKKAGPVDSYFTNDFIGC